MEGALREVTNFTLNTNTPTKPASTVPITDILAVSHPQIDFGECIPGSVHQRRLSITLLSSQPTSKIITITVKCNDTSLSELPQYIFGVRKEAGCEYFDEYRFRAAQKGVYNFVVGVKTPPLIEQENVPGQFLLAMEGTTGVIEVKLCQKAVMPRVVCAKELTDGDGMRMLKVGVIRNKSKKETKITFRSYPEGLAYTLLTDLVSGFEHSLGVVEVKPKVIQVMPGRGGFVISVSASVPEHKGQHVQRRVLVLRVKDTNIHYHFPLQVSFYPGSGAVTE